MAFASFDLVVAVKAARPADSTRLDRLTVDDGGARIEVFANAPTFGVAQRPVEAGPETGAAKLCEMIVHGLPRRKVAGQVAPKTARAQHIKQCIQDRAERKPAEAPLR